MTDRLNRFRQFLGHRRFSALAGLFLVTGLASAAFGIADQPWSASAQSISVLVFLAGAVVLIGGAMEGDQRYRWGAILGPALLALAIGVLVVPHLMPFAVGAALGWLVAGTLIFSRSREPLEYRAAVKAMRQGNFEEAVQAMDRIIREEPEVSHHYRFRAELLRFAGKLPRAKSDYERMKNLARTDADRAVAYNGMAEVDLQARQYASALKNAHKACELAPNDWVTAYNLGMIQDRLKDSEGVLDSLTHKLQLRDVPDARHRLLIGLYVLRAHQRLGHTEQAAAVVEQLRRDRAGLREWELLLAEKNAGVLREVLADDIALVRGLLNNQTDLEAVR
jgi:tetratricopeptide (TPR) repeat protein